MFGIKSKKNEIVTPEFVECRAYFGYAFHIRSTSQEDGLALCGAKPLDDKGEASADKVLTGLSHEHDGWFYCRECASIITGLSIAELNERKLSERQQ